VRLPAHSLWDVALKVVGAWQLLLILAAFIVAMLFMHFAIVTRVAKITEATKLISVGRPADLGVAKIDPKSRNELDQLSLATERLRLSINMAIERLTKKRPPSA